MKPTRKMIVVAVIAMSTLRLVGCFGAKAIDLSCCLWGVSNDTGTAIIPADGFIYVGGTSYGGFTASRLNTQGNLAPGDQANPWGFGQTDHSPPANPLGWVSFHPGSTTGTQTLNDMTLDDGLLYMTGSALTGNAIGFGVVSQATSDVLVSTTFSTNQFYTNAGDTPGGDIFIHNSKAYIFGVLRRSGDEDDLLWAGERNLDGSNTRSFGDLCGGAFTHCPTQELNTPTGFATLASDEVVYGSTTLSGSTAYSVISVAGPTENPTRWILVATINLDGPGEWVPLILDGDESSKYHAQSIAIQEDGKILVAGYQEAIADTSMFLIRYETDGTRDLSFGSFGEVALDLTLTADAINDIGIRPNGSIAAVGISGSSPFSARFLPDGTLDTEYSSTGYQVLSLPGYESGQFFVVAVGQRVRAAGNMVTNPPTSQTNLLVADLANATTP